MPGASIGVEGFHLPADIEFRKEVAPGSYVPVEVLEVNDLIAVTFHASVDADLGELVEWRVLPVDRDKQETTWTPWQETVTTVPEPGLSWAYLACALMLLALLRRRKRT